MRLNPVSPEIRFLSIRRWNYVPEFPQVERKLREAVGEAKSC